MAVLLLPLAGFFIYAAQVQMRFFALIALGLFFNIAILFTFYRRLKNKKAVVKLQREEYFEKANLLKADLEAGARAIAAFREKIIAYSQLKGLVEGLSMSLSLEDTVHTLCRETADLFDHPESTIILYLVEPGAGELAIAYAARNHHAVNIRMKRGDIFDRWVLKNRQALFVEDPQNDFRFDLSKIPEEDRRPMRSIISVPLAVHNKPVGILRLDSPVDGEYDKEGLRFLKTIGEVAAVAIENAQLFDRVEDLAIRDSLTGLYLRRYLTERLDEELSRHLRRDKTLAFVMLDLDHFKKYNDQFGHPAGDIVLRHLARLLEAHFNEPGDLICRYGGEEFCVLIPECDLQEAVARTRAFVARVEGHEMILRREKTRVTVSAGIAAFPKDAKVREDLIQKADAALYQAKNKGRNRVCVA